MNKYSLLVDFNKIQINIILKKILHRGLRRVRIRYVSRIILEVTCQLDNKFF